MTQSQFKVGDRVGIIEGSLEGQTATILEVEWIEDSQAYRYRIQTDDGRIHLIYESTLVLLSTKLTNLLPWIIGGIGILFLVRRRRR